MTARLVRLRADASLLPRLRLGDTDAFGGYVELRGRPRDLSTGSAVQIEFSFGAMADEITVRGHVVRIDSAGGALVEVVPEHKARLEHVHGVLRGARESVVRRHKRVSCRLPVVWRIDQQVHRDFTADVSCGGLFILSQQAPPDGRRIDLTLSLGPADSVALSGRVTWTGEARKERGFGVEFEGIDRETFARLRSLVRSVESG